MLIQQNSAPSISCLQGEKQLKAKINLLQPVFPLKTKLGRRHHVKSVQIRS